MKLKQLAVVGLIASIVSTLTDEQSVQQLREQMLADLVRNEEASRSRQPESLLAEVPQEEVIRLKPEDINPGVEQRCICRTRPRIAVNGPELT